jgi:hypothetical protein
MYARTGSSHAAGTRRRSTSIQNKDGAGDASALRRTRLTTNREANSGVEEGRRQVQVEKITTGSRAAS